MSIPPNYNEDFLPEPAFANIIDPSSIDAANTSSNAVFYRTELNSNIQITIPQGTPNGGGTLWTSPNIYLPINAFNYVYETTNIIYPNYRDAQILQVSTYTHSLLIKFKLTKADTTNFANQREIRTYLVMADGTTAYNSSIFSNQEPDTGQHDFILIDQSISHSINDIVKILFYIVQDDTLTDMSDSLLTVFRVSWNINS